MGSEIQEIKNTIVQRLPKRVQVAKVEFEGPEVVIYTKNPEIITENGDLIRDLAKDIRKRIIIRSDRSVLMEPEKAIQKIHGLAHITGGGFTNLKRLKKGTGYAIDTLPEPKPLFKSLQSLGVPLEEMYRVFNMGIGFVVIVNPEDADATVKIIEKYNKAYKIGYALEDQEEKVKVKTFKDTIIQL